VAGSFPIKVNPSASESSTYDLFGAATGKTVKTFTYDNFSNVIHSCTVYGDKSWTFVTNQYDPAAQDPRPDAWILGRLTKAIATNATERVVPNCMHPQAQLPGEFVTNTSDFTYDPKSGVLASETANSNEQLSLTTVYNR